MNKLKVGHYLSISFIIYLSVLSFYFPKDMKIIGLIYYGVINFLIMLFTLQDKSAAKNDKQRITELRFYVLSLLGGWFGGYIVQQWCRSCAWLHSLVVITVLSFYII